MKHNYFSILLLGIMVQSGFFACGDQNNGKRVIKKPTIQFPELDDVETIEQLEESPIELKKAHSRLPKLISKRQTLFLKNYEKENQDSANESCRIEKDSELSVRKMYYKYEEGHIKVELEKDKTQCPFNKGYLKYTDFKESSFFDSVILKVKNLISRFKKKDQVSVDSSVPYYCQNTNSIKPSSTCGNSSLAMALSSVLEKSITPDYLYNYNQKKFGYTLANSRYRFADVAKSLGAKSSRAAILSENEMKKELDKGSLLVMQGRFTTQYGHIVLVIGYNRTGFIVHDPFGKWNGGSTGSGYNKCNSGNPSGKNIVYSYREFKSQSLLKPNFSVGVISK